MVILETQKQMELFQQEYDSNDSILIPIMKDKYAHPLQNEVCFLYAYLMNGSKYIIPFEHPEINDTNGDIFQYINLENDRKKYVYDKKLFSHLFKLDNVYDVSLLYYLNTNEVLEVDDSGTNSHNFFNNQFYKLKNINTIIPVFKHIEKCDDLKDKLLEVINKYEINSVYDIYNKEVIPNLSYIEKSGLQTLQGNVYSEYNLFTTTGRPSNRFGGINFAALDKNDGSREKFISRFNGSGMLVEFDYESYHPRIIADIVGYDFPKDISIHEYLGKQYGTDDYNESKAITFRLLYGGIPKEIADSIPFYNKVQSYVREKWNEYKKTFSVKSDIYSREIGRHKDMNPNKLVNYLIQLSETEYNMKMFSKLIPFVEKHKSRLVLYNYDSVLIDFCMEDGVDFLKKVKEIMENDKFPTKVKYGTNYHEMKEMRGKINV